ncbi:AI-2E family transporter [Actinophytocola oryzae]|uniref:Putative PurR-regulated permease PerM n=1 Tax=Actinophytocola oryzae TaxID=502181 RepID=A0A4R7VZL9_9PSEU|nr:AI-2E family transporter [Actinophytocola oryzae]TDV55009.1 putative PurR-regulated permease PerM [Actinophytocola oryzae]
MTTSEQQAEPAEEQAESRRDPVARLRRVALTCLYLLIVAATLWVLGQVVTRLSVVVIPLAVALLLAALFAPAVTWLHDHRVPRGLATTAVLLAGLGAIGGLVYFMVTTLVDGLPGLADRLDDSYRQLRDWLTTGPLGLTGDQLDRMLDEAKDWVTRNRSQLASGALGVLSTAGAMLAGLAVVVFMLIFFLHEGARMWRGTTEFLPEPGRAKVRTAGEKAFHDLTSYVRTTLLVALIDAVGIGIGLWVTGVPLVLPLSALVFFGAFVPIVGAFVSGLVAVLIALVSQGLVVALIVTGVVVAVQQLEGNVLEPLLMSRSVRLHPVAILLAISVGIELGGIVGALFAVPLLATVRAAYRAMT